MRAQWFLLIFLWAVMAGRPAAALGVRGEPAFELLTPREADAWEMRPNRLGHLSEARLDAAQHLRTLVFQSQGFSTLYRGLSLSAPLGPWLGLGLAGRRDETQGWANGNVVADFWNLGIGAKLHPEWNLGLGIGGGLMEGPADSFYDRNVTVAAGRRAGLHDAGLWYTWDDSFGQNLYGLHADGPWFWSQGYRVHLINADGYWLEQRIGVDVRDGFGAIAYYGGTNQGEAIWIGGLGWARPKRTEMGFGMEAKAAYSQWEGLEGALMLQWAWATLQWAFGDRVSTYRLSLGKRF